MVFIWEENVFEKNLATQHLEFYNFYIIVCLGLMELNDNNKKGFLCSLLEFL